MNSDLVTQMCVEKMEWIDCLDGIANMSDKMQSEFMKALMVDDRAEIGRLVTLAIGDTAFNTFSDDTIEQMMGEI